MICHHCKENMDIVWGMASHGRAYCSETCFDERKGDGVLLYFMNDCRDLRLSALEYFEIAYQAAFNKPHPNPGLDYAAYLQHSELPVYVIRFIKEKQKCANSQGQLSLFDGSCGGSLSASPPA